MACVGRWLFRFPGKAEAIKDYMSYVIDYDGFKKEIAKLVLDYIDYGNCFATVEWKDETQVIKDKTKVGYIGPVIRRILLSIW